MATSFLPDTRRQQLDGIVQKAIQNGETDETIQFIVNDFKSKYSVTRDPVEIKPYQPSTIEKAQRVAQKVTDATGTTNLAKGLNATSQVIQSQLTGKPLDLTQQVPTNKQVIGSTGNLLATLGTMASLAPAAAGTGTLSTIGKTLQVAPTRAGRIKQAATLGGVSSASEAANKNKSEAEIATAGVIGSVLGAGTIGALEKGSEVIKNAANKRAINLYNSVLGLSKNEARNEVLYGTKTVGEKLVDKGGLPGFAKTKEGILDTSQKGIEVAEAKLQPLLKSLDKKGITIPTAEVVAPLEALQAESQRLGTPASPYIDSLITAIRAQGDSLTPSAANTLKRDYYKVLRAKNTNFGISPDQLPAFKQAVRTVASSLKAAIEKAGPNTKTGNVIRQLNEESGLHQEVYNKIVDSIAKQEIRSVQDLTKVLGGILKPSNIVGYGALGAVGSVAGGPVGALALPAVEKLVTSTPGLTSRAKLNALLANKQLPPQTVAAIQRIIASLEGKAAGN